MPSSTKRRAAWLRRSAVAALGGAAALAIASGCKVGAGEEQKTEASQPKEDLASLTLDEVSDGVAKKSLVIFDNNSKQVYAAGHVPTAKWVDYKAIKASDLPEDKAARLVFYCANES
jgi:hypothetical protein